MEKLEEMEHAAREIAKTLHRGIKTFQVESGEEWGFALMIFSYNGPEFTWVSNANREDMIKVMKEFIARNSQPEPSPTRVKGVES